MLFWGVAESLWVIISFNLNAGYPEAEPVILLSSS